MNKGLGLHTDKPEENICEGVWRADANIARQLADLPCPDNFIES
ncbi:MAG TPA: hypothetical protein VF269_00555 [Rhodanobacteraceae bacterium]